MKCLRSSPCFPKPASSLGQCDESQGNFLPQLTMHVILIILFNYHNFLRYNILQVIERGLERWSEFPSSHSQLGVKGGFERRSVQIQSLWPLHSLLLCLKQDLLIWNSLVFCLHKRDISFDDPLPFNQIFFLSESGEITFINYPVALTN